MSHGVSLERTRPSIGIPQGPMTPAARVSPRQPGTTPAVTIVEITDPTTANETLEVLNQDLVKLGLQPLRARRVTVDLDGGLVVFHRTNLRVRTRTTVHAGFVAYGACGPHAEASLNGLPMRPGTLLAAQAGTQVVFVAEPGYESVFVFLRLDENRGAPPGPAAGRGLSSATGRGNTPPGRRLGPTVLRVGKAPGRHRLPASGVVRGTEGSARRCPGRDHGDAAGDARRGDGLSDAPQRSHAPVSPPHRQGRRRLRLGVRRRPSQRHGTVQSRRGQRALVGVRLQRSHGDDACRLSHPGQTTLGAPGAARGNADVDDGLDRSAQERLLAFRGVFLRIQRVFWRAALGDSSTEGDWTAAVTGSPGTPRRWDRPSVDRPQLRRKTAYASGEAGFRTGVERREGACRPRRGMNPRVR